ncbi:galactokinase, partial [Candidatus Aerophobetes bacterium]|nr:galactokinase [Candidatus Aerophobetes bacterium]
SRFEDTRGVSCFKAPGRVNLIGEHTDYNDGLVLPFAINRHIYFIIRKRKDKTVLLHSLNFNEVREFKINKLLGRENKWSDYIQGILWEFKKRKLSISGFEAIIYGDIPIGAGLSSSAALEIVTCYGLSAVFNLHIPELELVKLCQQAENEFVGSKCGIMDQYVSFFAKKDKALFLDTRLLKHRFVDIALREVGMLVIDTGVKRSLASSEYNKRRRECEETVKLLRNYIDNLSSLRDLTPELLEKYRSKLTQLQRKRVKHVVEENIRVENMVAALEKQDMKMAGRLLFASHFSLKNLYEVSSPELDFLVELAQKEGILGARMTGAGFGGATIHLLFKRDIPEYCKVVKKEFFNRFARNPNIFKVRTSQGVCQII